MPSPDLPSLDRLTKRQHEVFELIAKGLSHSEIGAALGIVEDLIQRLSWWRLFPAVSRSST